MAKPTFTDEFKQGVVQYVLDHPDESKLSIAKRFDIADSTVHKWVKDADKIMVLLFPEVLVISLVMKLKKLLVCVRSLKIHRMRLMS